MESPGALTILLYEAINGRLEAPPPCLVETVQAMCFYWNDKYNDLLLKYFYEVKTRATSQQGFEASNKLNATKLINQAFAVRGCVPDKVEYHLKEVKTQYKTTKMLVDISGWAYNPVEMTIEADNSAWEDAITGNRDNAQFCHRKLCWFAIRKCMRQSNLATRSSVLHSTNGLPTPADEDPSPPSLEDIPDISPGHRRKRGGSASYEPARKHVVHEHKFDHEKTPLGTLTQALK